MKTTERLTSARTLLNSLTPALERVFLIGDYFHDYAVPKVSREASHELFRRKLALQPYYAVDHRGPKHLVIAATRYDEDAYLILEIDTKAVTHRPLNLDLVEWNTHLSRRYAVAAAR